MGRSKMSLKIFLVSSFLIALCAGQHANPADLDPLDEINEDEFEEYFHVDRPEDPEEYEKRKEALKENEKEIHEINEEFEAGDISWFDAVNEFSDLPADEFVAQHTGAIANFTEGRGLLNPLEADAVDEESEAYFREVEARASPPSVYDSRKYGFVSPVKNQRTCGSCVAFSSMATVETCFRKVTGVFGDYAEQQMVDCGYKKNGANGCNGAPPHAYIKYWGDNKLTLAHESQYPYLNDQPKLYCPRLPSYNQAPRLQVLITPTRQMKILSRSWSMKMEQQLLLSNPRVHSKSTREVFLLVVLLTLKLIMQSLLLVMVEKEAQTTGSSRTAGERAGVKMDLSD